MSHTHWPYLCGPVVAAAIARLNGQMHSVLVNFDDKCRVLPARPFIMAPTDNAIVYGHYGPWRAPFAPFAWPRNTCGPLIESSFAFNFNLINNTDNKFLISNYSANNVARYFHVFIFRQNNLK